MHKHQHETIIIGDSILLSIVVIIIIGLVVNVVQANECFCIQWNNVYMKRFFPYCRMNFPKCRMNLLLQSVPVPIRDLYKLNIDEVEMCTLLEMALLYTLVLQYSIKLLSMFTTSCMVYRLDNAFTPLYKSTFYDCE